MRSLPEATGQSEALRTARDWMKSPGKECLVISGPGGSGVSWTASQICVEWEQQGGVALKATGVAITPPRALLPWLTMRSPAQTDVARWETMKGGAAEASKAIPVVGDAASYLVSELLNRRRKVIARQARMLDEKEQDLLFVMENAAKGKRLLLTVDQLESWDEDSWGLLDLIVSPVLHDSYPALQNVLLLFGTAPEMLPRIRKLTEQLPSREAPLRRLSTAELAAALPVFSFPVLEEAGQALLFEATGGRLDLLRDVSSLLKDPRSSTLFGSEAAGYGQLIERRMRALQGDLAALDELLAAGSFLGHTFSREEAGCLTGYDAERLQALLELAETERFLGLSERTASFPSVTMQQYFRASRISHPSRYHAKFAECLRRLRPGDYEARHLHLLMAGREFEAQICHCLQVLDHRRRRGGMQAGKLRGSVDGTDLAAYLEAMLAAYEALDREALDEGLAILQSIESLVPDPLIAERDCLEAQFRLKGHRLAEFERAVVILKRWLPLREAEPEIWSRVAQTLVVALAETNQYEEAGFLEEALTKYYANRKALDPWALYSLNCLRRRSECIHQLVPARNRLENALAYFGPTRVGTVPRNPLQYYCTLTNLVSNLVAGGLFPEAAVRGAELKALIHANTAQAWPAMEIAANNVVLAGYLAGALSLPEALHLFQQIDEHRDGLGDRILIRNNHAVLLIHAGEVDAARVLLDGLQRELLGLAESDSYHRYLVTNNLAGLIALAGDPTRARAMLDEEAKGLARFLPGIRGVLQHRHAMMAVAIAAAPGLDARAYDRYLFDHHAMQIGPQWSFYGRGFLLSDIQFWAAE